MNSTFLGIDTSNYTTSAALVNADGVLIADERQVLTVAHGERGLRQSEALFQHVRNLPECIEQLGIAGGTLAGIAVSGSPRPVTDSYMPVFRVGMGFARAMAASVGVPLHIFSHQENHIRGALYGCGCAPDDMREPFLATHFSGGTSEILEVYPKGKGYRPEILGGTLDLNAGQLVDRIGVALGLPFPAGKALEALARQVDGTDLRISSRVEGICCHFSGQEQQAKQLIAKGCPPAEIALALFRSVAKTLERALREAGRQTGLRKVVFGGGVMANGIIRRVLQHRFEGSGYTLYFSDPKFATDNAVGQALLAWDSRELE